MSKKNEQPTNSNILHPSPGRRGFVVGDWDDPLNFYAVIPCTNNNKLVVFHDGEYIKTCNNEESARKFIDKRRRSRKTKKSKSKAPRIL